MEFFGNKDNSNVTISVINRIYASPFIVAKNGVANRIYIYFASEAVGSKFVLGLYSSERNKITQSEEKVLDSGIGWKYADIPNTIVLEGQSYIITEADNSGILSKAYDNTLGTLYFPFKSYNGVLPDVLPVTTIQGTLRIYCEFEPNPKYLSPDKNKPSGYHCFISQFVKNKLSGYIPLKTPDGVNRYW